MRKQLPFILLGLLAIAQLAAPVSIILRYENALSEGTELKFRTAIFDPYDPFRGRYVQLGFELASSNITLSDGIEFDPSFGDYVFRKPAYVLFAQGKDGFAKIAAITQNKPKTSGPWLRTIVTINWQNERGVVSIQLPFNKYFMNEKAAPEAERIYIEANRRMTPDRGAEQSRWRNSNYALVSIKDGTAAMESLIIHGMPIEELLKNSDSIPLGVTEASTPADQTDTAPSDNPSVTETEATGI